MSRLGRGMHGLEKGIWSRGEDTLMLFMTTCRCVHFFGGGK